MSKRKSSDSLENGPKKNKPNGHWSMGLLAAIDDPKLFIESDDLIHIIRDKYPKAKFHYLVLPKEDITSIKSVTSTHLSLLKHMEQVALELISRDKHKESTFKIGYHAEPSMSRLHLHVISDDMNSESLKTKKHWNSFTNDFFLKSEDVIKDLEKNGKIILPPREVCKKLMETPLKCHKCDVKPKNMPELKKHIVTHFNR
ncbi:aprataxin [Tribolium castaneum]|uniref:Aprataxin-like protein n=1 Tax=Tribolium castaneum TaxID=7070 RepID=D6WH85_TRICA|nr:PREDICTED: aprataxin [Tribolium castaneum]XP_970042.1 PREDICTED: aprataxin [Tribolium castaneum]EFA00986.1 Aprataxin-like protein [Tribolium castaneum]|eukprot:XP_008191423.1 PREDICTED: aprataxin [Tribolium castaneum]